MRVPVYDNLQAGLSATDNAQLRNQDVGAIGEIGARQAALTGQVLSNAGDALTQVTLQRQALVNEADVKQADIQASAAVRDLLRKPGTGFLNQHGASAVKAYDDVSKQITDIYAKAGEGLNNDDTRRMWGDVSQRRVDDALTQAEDHAGREQYVYAVQSAEDRIGNEIDGMGTSLGDQKAYDGHLATIRVESAHSAALQGIDPAEKLKTDLARAHMVVIRNKMAGNEPTVALTYYNAHKDELPEAARAEVEGQLHDAANASLALTKADQALTLFTPKTPYGGFDKVAINAWGGKEFGDNLAGFALFRDEIDRRIQDAAISQQTRLTAASDVIYGVIKTKGLTAARQTREWLELPVQVRDEIAYTASVSRAQLSGLNSADPQTRWASEAQAMSAAGNLSDADLRHMSGNEMRLRFGAVPGAFELVQHRQSSLGKPPLIPKPLVDVTLQSIGLKPNGGTAGDRARAGYMRFRLESAVLTEQARLGRTLSADETGTVINNNLMFAIDTANPDPLTHGASAFLRVHDPELKRVPAFERNQVSMQMADLFEQTGRSEYAPTEANLKRLVFARRQVMTGTPPKNGH